MACDLYYDSVVALLHFDGSAGSTTFTDATGKTWTANGNAQIDTAQSVFGGASLLLDGTGDYITTPDSADFDFGSGDFTVEFRVRPAAVGTVQQFIGQWASGGQAWHVLMGATGQVGFNANGAVIVNSGATLLANNTWYAVAVSRVSGTTRLFIDGTLVASAADAATYPNSTATLTIGRNDDAGGVWYFNGHIDEVRVTKGIGRYTASYTPDAAAFPEILCIALEGGIESAADLFGTLSKGIGLAGGAEAVGSIDGTLSTMDGSIEAAADLAGTITVNKLLAGGIEAAADLGNTTYLTTHEDSLARASAPILIEVRAQGTATAPIEIEVQYTTGTATAPIQIEVRSTGTATAPIEIAVVDSLAVTSWSLSASIGGVDVSANLTGQASVRMEEGGSRTAEFELHVASTPLNPLSYVGKDVSIDLLRNIGGVSVSAPLFRGVVEYPAYQPRAASLRLTCSQDLQHIIAGLDRTSIDSLTGGGYHSSVHGEIDDNWDYAQACMETQAASLDCGVMGNPRKTAWDGLTVWKTFTAADIDEPDIDISFPRRADLVNQVVCTFEYRYYRLRERHDWVSWAGSWLYADRLGSQYPTVHDIEAALNGAGWQVVSGVYIGQPERIPYADGYLEIPRTAVALANVHVAQRHSQTVTETQTLTVKAPKSIDNSGTIAQDLRGALATEWNPSAWESDINAPLSGVEEATAEGISIHAGGFQTGYSIGENPVTGEGMLGDYSFLPDGYTGGNLEIDWAPDAPRSQAESGIETLLNMARVKILRSHRLARVSATIDILPELDVHLAAGINITQAQAEGKVQAVEHVLDLGSGVAITRMTLAISGIGAAGVVSETPIAPPSVDTAQLLTDTVGEDSYTIPSLGLYTADEELYSDSLMGWLANTPQTLTIVDVPDGGGNLIEKTIVNPYYTPTKYPVTGFRAQLPGVDSARRNPADTAVAAEYLVQIPEDTFSL